MPQLSLALLQNKPIMLCIIGIIFILAVVYICQTRKYSKTKTKFNNISKIPLEAYFAPDIYLVPGQAKLGHNAYTPDYLPFESSVPAIDVLRANNQLKKTPQYLEQYLELNTTPYSRRN